MTEWHTYDAWRLAAVAHGPLHDWLNLVGGFAAPSFLYMAGLSQVLSDEAQARKGVAAATRRQGALERALWLLGVAYLFRLSIWLVDGGWRAGGGWRGLAIAFVQDVLKVDILNVIAVSLFLGALAGMGRGARAGLWTAAAGTAIFAFLTPVVAAHPPPASPLGEYVWNARSSFALFPWAGFLLGGSVVGRLVAGRDRPLWLVAAGAATWLVARWADGWPPVYAHQDFWRASPSWFFMRLGIVVAMTGVLMLLPAAADRMLSWLRTMGRHSLLGYVLSVLIPYGGISRALHHRLSVRGALAAVVAMVAFIWAASALMDRWEERKARRPAQAAG
jgi:uncharacterized membrane protein